ncbi:PDZ GRASP-type domain-containing protein [Plasmodiophora brassicae]
MGTAGSRDLDADAVAAGWRITEIRPGSPSASSDLIPFFDFIIGAGDVVFTNDEKDMFRVIQDHIGKPLDFRVWNSMTQSVRECSITPSTWSGDGVLGLVIKYDDLDFDSTPPSIHVLDIFPNSPSSKAGLQAFDDYLLGTPEVVFVGLEEFDDVILNAPPPIRIFVYNRRSCTIRTIDLAPDCKWGGPGSIGCDVACGILHRIPTETRPVRYVSNGKASSTYTPGNCV